MAGRIPQAFIDTLLDRVDIVEVVDRRVKLKKTGKNYSARCPFHDEKTPSFTVNPERQFYYCFGCGAGGNALGFLMDYENLEFPAAVENLAASAGLEVQRETAAGGREQPDTSSQTRPLYQLLEDVARFYRQQLRRHPQAVRAVDYLKNRGLTGQIAKQFDLGFAPPGWDNLLKELGDTDQQRSLLLESGMLIENEAGRIYDRFRDRVIFPIRDQRGRVVAFGGRVLGDDKPKYLNSPETPVFQKGRELYGLYEARRANRHLESLLVVEGYMDVIALAQHGIGNATATLGTATSKVHIERIYRLCPRVVFCFDGDEAGRKAAFRALESTLPCMQDGRQASFLFLPEGEDPDTAVRSGGPEAFLQSISQATPLENYLFEAVAEGLDIDSLDGRARLSKLAVPYLRQLPEGVYRQLMFQKLAELTGLELSSMMRLQESESAIEPGKPTAADTPLDSAQATPPRKRTVFKASASGYSNLAQKAMALLLHRPEMARHADPATVAELPGDDAGLLRELLELLRKRPESNTAMLLGRWYGTPEGELLNRLAGQERLIPTEGIEREFVDTLRQLSELPGHSQLAAQVDKLKLTDYAKVSELEKQQLRELLQEKQQRDTERKNRKP